MTYLVLVSDSPRSAPRSEPAKSIKLSLPWMALRFFLGLSKIWRTAWDREEVSFAPVEPIQPIRCHPSPIIIIIIPYLYYGFGYHRQTLVQGYQHC